MRLVAKLSSARILEWTARGGFAARGLVYLMLGALVAAAALGNAAKALPRRLDRELDCPGGVRRWAVPVGRAGHLSRALVLALIGAFSIEAALGPGALRPVTLGEVLRSLEAQPFGSLALAGTALGLAAFGAYALVEARYHRAAAPRRPA